MFQIEAMPVAKPQMLDIVLAEQIPLKVFKQHRLAFQKLAVKLLTCNTRTSVHSSESHCLNLEGFHKWEMTLWSWDMDKIMHD